MPSGVGKVGFQGHGPALQFFCSGKVPCSTWCEGCLSTGSCPSLAQLLTANGCPDIYGSSESACEYYLLGHKYEMFLHLKHIFWGWLRSVVITHRAQEAGFHVADRV